ncbi:MAG: glycosyltransferase family 2 protein [Candidatus Caldarchaeum sp.]|nr:glycosyltransferase family 2 protein [Candidatus Caldarchaeum sp.]
MTRPWCSIIVPTLMENPIILGSLPDEDLLRSRGFELIVVWDRFGWKSPSRSLNIGAAVARGSVFCFIDDDAGFDFEALVEAIKTVKNEERSFYWTTEPHILIVHRAVFFKMGGYDERYGLPGNFDVELRERLKHFGYVMLSFPYETVKPQHLRPSVWNRKRFYRMQKQLTVTYVRYRSFPLRKVLWRKHPVELARRWIWVLEWALITRWRKRSTLSQG